MFSSKLDLNYFLKVGRISARESESKGLICISTCIDLKFFNYELDLFQICEDINKSNSIKRIYKQVDPNIAFYKNNKIANKKS